ncbi:MAG: hypothetical protein EOP48_22020 [Sphingobacteriales bacterium]|nr:MAG: hypothetical protein EOP48_22020 [Sphingobacteriales bacterium]
MTGCPPNPRTVPAAYQIGKPDCRSSQSAVAPAATNWKAKIRAEMVTEMQACNFHGWDGENAKALSAEAYGLAYAFLDALPDALPEPRFIAEPDGCFAFEWHKSPWRSLVVSISPDYRLYYSALLDEATDETASGSEPFFSKIPTPVKELLLKIYSHRS